MKTINKRLCRKFAFPETRFQKNSGLLHHANIKYVVRAAVKNIDGHRTLILYLYAASEATDGRIVPLFISMKIHICNLGDERSSRPSFQRKEVKDRADLQRRKNRAVVL